MKRFVLTAIIVLAIACTAEEKTGYDAIVYPAEISASIAYEAFSPETKVYADETLHVLWDNDDRISLFNKYTYNKEYRFTGATGANSGTFQEVSTSDVIVGNELDCVYAVYPHQPQTEISNSGILSVNLPEEQHYKENSFGQGANIMVSATPNTDLLFKNLCGYLVIKLYGEGVSVASIAIKGNTNEILAGTADVTTAVGSSPTMSFGSTGASRELTLICDTPVTLGATADESTVFWLVVPPTSFPSGFTLTVTDPDGNIFEKTANIDFKVERNKTFRMAALEVAIEQEGQLPIPEAVDMGLSVKWASFNLGASAPEEYGLYYAWGETSAKEQFGWNGYKWCHGTENSLTKYNHDKAYGDIDNKNILDLEDDAASVLLKGGWHIPSVEDWAELMNEDLCEWTKTSQGNNNGYEVRSKITGNSIFLPFGGVISTKHYSLGSMGYYWLANLMSSGSQASYQTPSSAAIGYCQNFIDCYYTSRSSGANIRPVLKQERPIKLNKSQIQLLDCGGANLSASFIEGFDNIPIVWTSKDDVIATVSSTGEVVAHTAGSTIISASSPDGEYSAYCSVTVFPSPDIVDMGLSVKWASFNIGAYSISDYGAYFAWGEIEPKDSFSWENYKWCNGSKTSLTKYNKTANCGIVDNKIVLDPEDDAAQVLSNGRWRMPTMAEFKELKENCTITVDTYVEFVSNINGNRIVFPKSGWIRNTSLNMYGPGGLNYSWTINLLDDSSYSWAAWYNSGSDLYTGERCSGDTIRAVYVDD